MTKVKQFIKDHKKELIILGGVSLVLMVITVLRGNKVNAMIDVGNEVNRPGYDIWAMVGTKCSPELFEELTKVVENYGKTINFEILD